MSILPSPFLESINLKKKLQKSELKKIEYYRACPLWSKKFTFERYAGSYTLLLCFFSYLCPNASFSEDRLKTITLLIFQQNTNKSLEGCYFETREKMSILSLSFL